MKTETLAEIERQITNERITITTKDSGPAMYRREYGTIETTTDTLWFSYGEFPSIVGEDKEGHSIEKIVFDARVELRGTLWTGQRALRLLRAAGINPK